MEKERVLLGMSGGVDSSVSALLLIKQGYEVIGATMKLHDNINDLNTDIEDARNLCQKLGIKHYVFDFTAEFDKYVVNNFTSTYLDAKTPNPCIECNRKLKFGKLYEKAKELNCKYIATRTLCKY